MEDIKIDKGPFPKEKLVDNGPFIKEDLNYKGPFPKESLIDKGPYIKEDLKDNGPFPKTSPSYKLVVEEEYTPEESSEQPKTR